MGNHADAGTHGITIRHRNFEGRCCIHHDQYRISGTSSVNQQEPSYISDSAVLVASKHQYSRIYTVRCQYGAHRVSLLFSTSFWRTHIRLQHTDVSTMARGQQRYHQRPVHSRRRAYHSLPIRSSAEFWNVRKLGSHVRFGQVYLVRDARSSSYCVSFACVFFFIGLFVLFLFSVTFGMLKFRDINGSLSRYNAVGHYRKLYRS